MAAERNESYFSFSNIVKIVLFFFVLNTLIQNIFGSKKTEIVESSSEAGSTGNIVKNLWKAGQKFDAQIFIFNDQTGKYKKAQTMKNLEYGSSEDQMANFTYPFSDSLGSETKSVKSKITFYRSGYSHDKKSENYDQLSFSKNIELVKVLKKRKSDEQSKKLVFKSDNDDKEQDTREEIPHFDTKINIRLISDPSEYKKGRIPPHLLKNIIFHPNKADSYMPIVFQDTFMTLNEDLVKLNESGNKVSLSFTIGTTSKMKFFMKDQIDHSFKMQNKAMGGNMNKEFDDLKRMFKDNNLYFLALTGIVSVVHMIFEFLAFKNDIAFWNKRKDTHGLSVRSIFVDCFCSVIIFLYLLENETSKMILASSFMTIFIDIWKLKKAFKIQLNVNGGILNITNWLIFEPITEGDEKSTTDEYDKTAIKVLCCCLLPLVAIYSVYSLLYEEHKGWYQWLLNTLVGSVYTFGFITMCPQLYINYKLQSVAHLPWRMMTYKSLNTVIDDLFAFIIKMPMLHRLACFRDDIVFAVFLYQKWKYRVDYSRTNEFGFKPKEKEGEEEKKLKDAVKDVVKNVVKEKQN